MKERYRTDSGQLSNLYDFSGLTAAVIKLALAKGIVADPASEADEDTPGVTNDLPPRSKKTYPPRSSMTHEEEISNKNQNNKKQFSNVRSDTVAKTQKEGNGGNGTYSHIAATAIGNGHKPVKPNTRTAKPTQPGKTGMTKLGDMLQDRLQDLMTQSTADPPKLPNGYTEEEDAIALYIEPYSRELGDEGHSKSNIRQAINIFTDIKSEIPELTVGQYLYILETFKDVVQYRRGVKNKMAYYFTCLRNHLWPQEHTQAKQGSLFN